MKTEFNFGGMDVPSRLRLRLPIDFIFATSVVALAESVASIRTFGSGQ
jgi:hypothetical protein